MGRGSRAPVPGEPAAPEPLPCREVVWDGRELDWVEPPSGCREYIRGVGARFLVHPAFEAGFSKLLAEYEPPRGRLLLILPCSYGKPYGQSFIHYAIRRRLWRAGLLDKIHEVMVTNAGVVPRELEEMWPYCAYDWNPAMESEDARLCYRVVLERRLKAYLSRFHSYYVGFAAYLRWGSDSWAALEAAARALGLHVPNLAPREWEVPSRELEEVSLGGLYGDPDLVLITDYSLSRLEKRLRSLLGA